MNDVSRTIGWCNYSVNYFDLINNKIVFYPSRITRDFYNLRHESGETILVCPDIDIFHNDINHDWVEKIIEFCRILPRHKFYFLTRIPWGYSHYTWPSNCNLGVICEKFNISRIETMRNMLHSGHKFISIDPILDSFDGVDLSMFDFVIVGAMSGHNVIKPLKSWIENIKHKHIHWKGTIVKAIPEMFE